jgi:photosystem II stability/assembly factor-like uncharacterized protein
MHTRLVLWTGLLSVLMLAGPLPAQRRPSAPSTPPLLDPTQYAALRHRYIGPVGNRVSAVAGVPGDFNTYYAGAASGGIWKTVDAGIHWQPIFDDQPVQSIGALAVAPSDPNLVWAGTGEAFVRSHISIGNGVYRSTDAGRTWHHLGLVNTGRIARIVVHPTNPDIVYVAAMGHSYGPQQERGLYRTMDGGKTWQRVLFVDPNTGASDIVIDPNNPRILYAGMWQLEIRTWGRQSGGPGGGIFVSRDGGTNWMRLTGRGLPRNPVGKIGLAIPRTNPNRIYALIETGDGVEPKGSPADRGELWRSDDGGETWRVVSYDRNLACRQPYYTRLAIATDNDNEAYFLCASFSKSLDGGATAEVMSAGQTPGGDNHDMWIDPGNANRMAVANDGGVSISTTRGRSWLRVQLPIAQMYHVTVDNAIPYFVYGNKQDGPSYRGPSNSLSGATIARSEWHGVGGGESGWATPDPTDPNIVWSSASGSGSVGGIMTRMDLRTRHAQNVEIWPVSTIGHPAADVKYRFVWTFPLTISPHDNNRVYAGSQHVHVTNDGGKSWDVISPDLTLNDRSKQQISGGLTPDNIGVEYGNVIFSIAESPMQKNLIWVGTNDGLVQLSRDGANWEKVTPTGMPAGGTVSHIEPSRYDAATAFIAVDGHQANFRDPALFRTTDFGKTWTLIVNGIPKSPMSYTHIIREDPVRRGLLYAGTENGLYVSFNNGDVWQPLQLNLPGAPVYSMVIQRTFNDLVIATYGRGFWILDDLSPLQQITPEVVAAEAHLFMPRLAYRFRNVPGNYNMTDDPTAGRNPEYGATISYWLRSAGEAAPRFSIIDAGGKVIRTMQGTRTVGINRVHWDLRFDPSREARLRTAPEGAPEVRPGPDGTRPAPGIGRMSILAPPSTYSVKMTIGGREYTQPLRVLKDPLSEGTEQDIAQQMELLQLVQTDVNAAVEMVNRIEVVRAQLQQLGNLVSASADPNAKGSDELRVATDSLEQKFKAVEWKLHELRLTGRGQDNVRWPIRLVGKLLYLQGGIASSDFAPTTQQREVQKLLSSEVRDVKGQLEQLMTQELPAFNEMLRRRNIANIIGGE